MKKTTVTGSKHIKVFFIIFTNICHITKWNLIILKNAVFFFKILKSLDG